MSFKIDELPFIYNPIKTIDNENDIPNFLSIELIEDVFTNLIKQFTDDNKVLNYLNKIYLLQESNLPGMIREETSGEYIEHFINFIVEKIPEYSCLKDLHILEIGCGTGFLLKKLKENGAKVIGIDPLESPKRYSEEYNVEIIKDFFPSDKLDGLKFDIIINHLVLEHINDLGDFLFGCKKLLKNDNSLLISGTVNSEVYLEHGDLSLLFHEHLNYFTKNTLFKTLEFYNFESEIYEWDNNLLISISKNKNNLNLLSYKVNIEKSLSKIKKLIDNSDDIGIYIPYRAINSLYMIYGDQINEMTKLRFFDDNPVLHNTYIPGIIIKIENFEDLLKKSPKLILIFSNTYSEKIKNKILDSKKLKIMTWDEIFKGDF